MQQQQQRRTSGEMNAEKEGVLLELEEDDEEEEGEEEEDGEMVLEEVEQDVFQSYGTMPGQQPLHKPEWAEFNLKPDSLYFNDGQRRIDFLLVYEDESKKQHKRSFQKKQMRKRLAYESNLINCGLQLEATSSVVDEKLIFVKVHAPWELLCSFAEIMHIKLPLQPNDLKTRDSPFKWISRFFSVDENIIKPEQEFFTAPFEIDRLSDFYIQDKETFFNPATRSRIVHFILCRGEYAIRDNVRKFGINKLLDSGIYKAAFPLHDSRFNYQSEDPNCPNERYLLYREWAHPRNIFKLQPLDLVRKYYGEKIGIYFAWLGFYTQMLLLAAVVGLGCFLYGYFMKDNCTWSQEVCDPNIGGKIIMCPQCDQECTYWNLTITCESSKKLCIFDSFGTLVFAVFMGVWVTLFLEFWKRRQAELEYEWDTVEFLEQEEQVRPEYEARCHRVVVNEITQQEEHIPYTACGKCVRMTFCTSAVLFWILLIIASVIGIIVYRLSVFLVFSATLPRHINGTEAIQKYLTPQAATSVSASIISFIIIMILNMIYEKVAIMITDFELPRTQTDYENSLTMKMFLFQFVNYYSSCFYIAFFKGKFVGYPGDPVYWLGKYRNEECDPGGCLLELTTQLTIIMGGKAIWNNIQEVLLPWLKNLIGRFCSASRSEKVVPRWEQDYHLQPIGKLGLFYEYLEMVIQFGFVTLFVASFPLAPLLALMNNLLEIRIDAWKITTQFRRIVPQKAQDIGAWQPIMQGIALLAVVTNAMIIAFTSDMIPRLVYYWSFSVPPYGSQSTYSMKGYINNTLSVFAVSDFRNESKPAALPMFANQTTCRYRDFRYPPGHEHQYEHNIYYWHVIAAKLSFIIVMEHIIYLVTFAISHIIPDVSKKTKSKIKREKYLIQTLLHENPVKAMKKNMGSIADKILKGADGTFRPKTE
ncbi:anoctamin-6 isoform X1 [Podarcis raffonei]|uniref:anoctamin-6 isoform X1 n=1 Tax=Podarcis raffonei TaxID=65483 RepID=UPI0023290C2F|nr:anoctamin-6 isoform X1 [Podarcis raffonei]